MTLFSYFLLIQVAYGLTSEEKLLRKEASEEADKMIDFLPLTSIQSTIQKGTWLILFGVPTCTFTQRITPIWLSIQEKVKQEQEEHNFHIRKCDCSLDEDFCANEYEVNGYPTIILFDNGRRMQEYLDEDEETPLFAFVQAEMKKRRQLFINKPAQLNQPPALPRSQHLEGEGQSDPANTPLKSSVIEANEEGEQTYSIVSSFYFFLLIVVLFLVLFKRGFLRRFI